jgi:hypothetical protein
MKPSSAVRNCVTATKVALIVLLGLATNTSSAGHSYSAKSSDQVSVISLVLASEAEANHWGKSESICLSINYRDPARKLIEALRESGLEVHKLSEWHKRFACGFLVEIRFLNFDPDHRATVRAEIGDVREINSGNSDLALQGRKGEYTLSKNEGKWCLGTTSL